MNQKSITLGAVAYDPKVVTIWDGFSQFFGEHGLELDYVLYSNYERQVEGHFAGEFDIAWNSPLAWIEAQRLAALRGRAVEAVAMRDSDQDLTSLIVVKATSSIQSLEDLRGKKVGVGARDSPQATLIPLVEIAERGLAPGQDFEVVPHDRLVGKHGDHVGGERDAAQALMAQTIDAACMIDANHLLFARENIFPPGSTRVIHQSAAYDHCNFTVFRKGQEDRVARFVDLLLGMSYDDPTVRPLLDLEGLKSWKPGRESGYQTLERAVDRFSYLDPWLERMKKQMSR